MLYTSGLRESGKLVFRNPGWHGPVHMCGFQCLLTPGESQCYHMPPPLYAHGETQASPFDV